jgi:type IV pilus biogenesis protein PilP
MAKATKRPSFPRRASVANNATIANIIELNRTNLIGVFGTTRNAIALIRLASGRVIKVKVGDQFDGWKVLTIDKDKIKLANGKKQETLRLPG